MRILYVTGSAYPGDSAYSTRIDGLCQSLQLASVQTDVLTDYSNLDSQEFTYNNSNVRVGAKHSFYKRSIMDKLLASWRMSWNLHYLLQSKQYDCVIMSSMYMRANRLLNIARKHNIPLILESCEWFESYNWTKGEKSYRYKRYVKAWNNYFIKADGVIAISRLLEEHYKEFTPHVIRIPTVMNIPKENINAHHYMPLKLIFTGSIAWGKDRLLELIYAIDSLHQEGVIVQLDIYGPSRNDIINQLDGDNDVLLRNEDEIIVHGRVSHDEIIKRISESDFGVILRPDRKQSNAGFPTKLAEYMSVGTSVIANDTGDIGLYLKNGHNGFLIPTDFSSDELVDLIKRLVVMSQDDINDIKSNAYKTALESFSCGSYSKSLYSFLNEIVCSRKKVKQ